MMTATAQADEVLQVWTLNNRGKLQARAVKQPTRGELLMSLPQKKLVRLAEKVVKLAEEVVNYDK